ncbi:hemerythrin domain-containing protein [Flexistipes sp.]|uniref:hemerythrin domain-containing protein n=1 Tax=Flexistipes sp. TaxID=3088135 RepID=UPI002E1BBE50|nr:hemerythrin domain-containing protein [Flexistipes sp.]
MKSTEQLKNEHEGIKIMLEVLESIAEYIEKGKVNKLEEDEIRNTVTFFREFADKCHHTKEERELFPTLEKAGIQKEGGPIGVMLDEHEMGRNHIRAMLESLDDLAESEIAAEKFADNAYAYVELLRQHIDKENDILFRMAELSLGSDMDNKLFQRFEEIEEKEMGEGTHEKYHKMIDEYRKKFLR